MQPEAEEDDTSNQQGSSSSVPDAVTSQQVHPQPASTHGNSSAIHNNTNQTTRYVWSWKETSSQMMQYSSRDIVGDPSDCWIRYGRFSNQKLETAYTNRDATCDLDPRYVVDLRNMRQINKGTGFQRQVQRTVDKPKIWCWKEFQGLMWRHNPSTIYGNPSDRWIQYNQVITDQLERCYLEAEEEEISITNGIVVNFDDMVETNEATGMEREVQRVDAKEQEEEEDEDEPVVPDQAASSSSNVAAAPPAPVQKVWCWKETDGFQWNHDPSTIYGDPANCWIMYDHQATQILEDAFQRQPFGIVSPMQGYNVNLAVMKQVNIVTGFERDVQRVDPIEEEEEEDALTMEQAQEMITKLQTDSTTLKAKQDEMEQELKTVRTELHETQSELKQSTQERDGLKAQVAIMQETLDALQKSVDLLVQNQASVPAEKPPEPSSMKRSRADLDTTEGESEQDQKKPAV